MPRVAINGQQLEAASGRLFRVPGRYAPLPALAVGLLMLWLLAGCANGTRAPIVNIFTDSFTTFAKNGDQAERAAEIARRMAAYTARAEREGEDDDAADPATNLTLERRRELEALVEAQLRSLMTPLERVAVLEADLRLARAAGFEITEAQIEQILTEARAREGLVSGLGDELAARQAILDAGAVVPRLRPAKRGSGVLDGLEDPAAAKFKVQQDQAAEAGQVLEAAIERDRAALASGVARFAADGFRAGMTRGLDGALGTMRDRLSDMLMDVFFNSMRNGMMNALNGLSVGSGGLGGLVRGAAGLFGLSIGGGAAGGAAGFVPGPGVKTPGLDGGGDLLIGGRGMDRSLLSIDGSPVARVGAEERVRVVPRGGEGARPAVHQHFHMHAEGAVMTSELMASLQAQANDTAAVAVAESVDIADARAARRAKRSRYALGRG